MEQTVNVDHVHKKYNRLFGAFVFLFSLGIFVYTTAPTVQFWDCGEYIAAGHSLAIPHPPGNPLFMMLCRLASMALFFLKDIGYRITLLATACSAVVALISYLTGVRVMIALFGVPDVTWKRIVVYLSGIVGAFFSVFNYTFWFSAVEASECNPSMVIQVLCAWLVLIWYQSKDEHRDRWLILISYLAYLGICIHMTGFMAIIPAFLFIVLVDEEKRKDWRFWALGFVMGAVIYSVASFLWLGPLAVLLTFAFSYIDKASSKKWRLYFWIALFALIGYSAHTYIPIRSTAQPLVDENHPVIEFDKSTGKLKADAFMDFLLRKQYGQESMVTRSFWRLGAWNKQFGFDGHMGYGGFHLTQFFHFGRSIFTDRENSPVVNYGFGGGLIRIFIYLIPTFLMLFGWYYVYKRNRNIAGLLITLFLIGSIFLVIYMNFADGTRPMKRDYQMWVKSGRQGQMPLQHREVRERDYFFTSGFMFFGLWMGIAAGCVLHAMYSNKNRLLRTQLAPILTVLFAVSPALPITQNLPQNNRRGDYIPFDYAYNLLMSCDQDGVLFTNGDNDTFPLWALQEAYGIRKDVRIVNLSLLNTTWYVKQLKILEPKVPISYTINEIDTKLDHRYNPLEKAINWKMPNAGIVVTLPGRDTKHALRVQDQMVINIVDSNKWKKPIYFAVTVAGENLMGLEPYLQMQGLVYRVLPGMVQREEQFDYDKTLFLIEKVYKFRTSGEGFAPMSETSEKLMSNYAACFIQLVITLRQPLAAMKGEIDALQASLTDSLARTDTTAYDEKKKEVETKKTGYNRMVDLSVNKLDQCIAIMPWDWRPRLLQQEVLLGSERFDQAMGKIDIALKIEPANQEYLKVKARLLELKGDKAQAIDILKGLAADESDPWQSYGMICKNYEDLGQYDSAIEVMKQFQLEHPGDRRAAYMINRLEQLKQQSEKKETDTAGKIQAEKTAGAKG